LIGCGSSPAPAVCTDAFDFVVVGSDYSSTQVGGAALDGRVAMKGTVDLGGDPALAISAGRDFLIARDTGAVFELDPKCGVGIGRFSANDIDVADGGVKPNPQDLSVAADGSLWIPRYSGPLLVLGAKGETLSRIDLSALDTDGNPEASGIVIEDTRAFVVLERLETMQMYKSIRPSMLAVFDTTSRMLLQTVTLQGRNPVQGKPFVDAAGAIWLTDAGSFYDIEKDAGIEKFDPTTLTSTLVMSEIALGANAIAMTVSGSCTVAILADTTMNNRTSLVTLDLTMKRITAQLLNTEGFDLAGLFMDDVRLVGGDRRKGDLGYPLHVFKRLSTQQGACAFQRDRDIWVSAPPIAIARTPLK
jgi:hypothetical protein